MKLRELLAELHLRQDLDNSKLFHFEDDRELDYEVRTDMPQAEVVEADYHHGSQVVWIILREL